MGLSFISSVTRAVEINRLFRPAKGLDTVLIYRKVDKGLLPRGLTIQHFLGMFTGPMVIRQTRRVLFGHLLRTGLVHSIVTGWFGGVHAVDAFQHYHRAGRRVEYRVVGGSLVQVDNNVIGFISRGVVRVVFTRLYRGFQPERNLRNNRRVFAVILFAYSKGWSGLVVNTAGRFLV